MSEMFDSDSSSSSESPSHHFTVADFFSEASAGYRGQAFTPNVPGPNGTGGPGAATSVKVHKFILGYPTADATGRADCIYIYSVELTDSSQIGQAANLVASSISDHSDQSAFGMGSHTRTFFFHVKQGMPLTPYATYYVYFDSDQNACATSTTPYPGGNAYGTDMSEKAGTSLQFLTALVD